jgi:hypothetical protein
VDLPMNLMKIEHPVAKQTNLLEHLESKKSAGNKPLSPETIPFVVGG